MAAAALALGLCGALLAGCAAGAPDAGAETQLGTLEPQLPPAGAVPDYQLGGAYAPDAGVGIVVRDRLAPPAKGVYSVCYVNAFQTQPGEVADWPEDLLLTVDGEPVADPGWPDELLLDTSTAAKREAIAGIVEPWISRCANDGFAAVEFDNLDSFTRSRGILAGSDNAALAERLVGIAHDAGLAAAQKNSAESAAVLRESAGFDFAVSEECMVTGECGDFAAVYGAHVIDIEYAEQLADPESETYRTDAEAAFAAFCADAGAPASMVLRDVDLTVPGDPAHVRATC